MRIPRLAGIQTEEKASPTRTIKGETVEVSPAYLENLAKGLSRCLSLAVSFPVEKPSSNHTPIIYLSHFSIAGPNKHPSQSSQQTLH